MKKILSALFGIAIGFYTFTAFANHMGLPEVNQERREIIWACLTIEDARIFVTAREEVESYEDWIDILRGMVGPNRCMMGQVEYTVEEVVETISGLAVENRSFGEPITHYILKSAGHYVVTY